MTRRFLMTLALGTLLCGPAFAQQTPDQPAERNAAGGWKHGRRGQMGDRRMNMLARSLNLSSEQQTQIRKALADERQQVRTLRQDSSLSQQDFRSKVKSLHQSTQSQIRAALNSEQQTKYDQMREQMKSRGSGRRGPGGKAPQNNGSPS